MRIALVGAGSLGTIAGALLSKVGLDIVLVDANEEHVNALNSMGARIEGHMEATIPVKAIRPHDMEGTYDLFIYMVKATFDDVALPGLLPFMRPDSMLITLQNGVPEERVASLVGRERTLGGGSRVGWHLEGPRSIGAHQHPRRHDLRRRGARREPHRAHRDDQGGPGQRGRGFDHR